MKLLVRNMGNMQPPFRPQFGVIGYPISHSRSPQIHNSAFQHFGINAEYLAIEVKPDQLPVIIERIRNGELNGINVTVPHKQAVIPYLNGMDAQAQKIGAVNTIVNTSKGPFGYNTDLIGFSASLTEDLSFNHSGKRAAIIGAGGAARAIGFALIEKKVGMDTDFLSESQSRPGVTHLDIINRTLSSAEALKSSLLQHIALNPDIIIQTHLSESPTSINALHHADLIVQTTSVGMAPDMAQAPLQNMSWVRPHQTVIDIIYTPAETLFLQQCKNKGAKTGNGVGMLIGQAAWAFLLFNNTLNTNHHPPIRFPEVYTVMTKNFYNR